MNFLLYLDELLVTGLSSVIAEGYIEILTRKRVWDRSLLGRFNIENKETNFCEDRYSKEKKEGYKNYTNSDSNTYTCGIDDNKTIENRGCLRLEEEEKRIYTMFSFHRNILLDLENRGKVKSTNDVCSGNVQEGDYVKLKGLLCSESLSSYIDSLKSIIDCFGCDKLNDLREDKGIMDFSVIDKFLSEIQLKLHLNDTSDLILKCGNKDLVITINNNYFLNNHTNKYDHIDCSCNIFGKIVKKCCNDNEDIHFLRKTGQKDFYEDMLNMCIPAFDCLNKIGITPPTCPRTKMIERPYQIIPISIYI
ncbi:hypothetical protein ACFO6R_05705 [Eubacterium multiforme]|uniref:Uncharacterized protein n=1 Tax=Eubacterium multiforme TaxID=83339 RepID=A0ABT9UQZ6_9FIRM|nr:hypothetical protein [Eubacterium multiforme]MDQ0149077.1 hypothetical protein [Eubacterium multiforme]